MSKAYKELFKKFDTISYGFPKSWLGMDKMFLKAIFTEEDAQDWVKMKDGYQTAADYAQLCGISEEEAVEKLNRMVMKGEIYRRHRKDAAGTYEYERHPWALGVMEWQIHNPKKQFYYSLMGYMISSKIGARMSQTMPFYRTVPIHKEYVEGTVVAPYEDIESILGKHTRFAVADCICRVLKAVMPNNPCHHDIRCCIMTDDYATFYIETGMGEEITYEEALEILQSGEKDGRVINVTNSKDGENICSCCECGCGMLWMKRQFPGPSQDFWGNYFSHVDEEKCIVCGSCAKKCPFGVISVKPGPEHGNRGTLHIDTDKCLGCGLCISACKRGGLRLHRKPDHMAYMPPETNEEAVQIWSKITKRD